MSIGNNFTSLQSSYHQTSHIRGIFLKSRPAPLGSIKSNIKKPKKSCSAFRNKRICECLKNFLNNK